MGIKVFQPDSGLFEELLIQNQIGHGALGRFRGWEFQNGSGLGSFLRSIFSRVSRFTAPLVRTAMPHVKSALESAKPHSSTAAKSAFDEASRGVVNKLLEIIGSAATESNNQAGTGRKRKVIYKKKLPRQSVTRLRRIPPFDLPDSF